MSDAAILGRLADAVERLDAQAVQPLISEAMASGHTPSDILSNGLSKGMQRVGAKFKTGEMFMPEVLVACDVYYAGLGILKPLLAAKGDSHVVATVVLGTIYGDVHTVGKDVAIPVFEASGLRVVDLGVNVDDQKFVDAIRQHKPAIVGLGTYMTSTFMHTKETVAAIAKAGLRDQVKIICGGPAVDAETARKMGADDASDDAWKGVDKIMQLLATMKN
jgi:5-methyltetrahydrofolate--homocysteine methyltransferase